MEALIIWAFSTLGAGAVGVAVWGGKKVLIRLDSIEQLLANEMKDIRETLHEHEIRIVRIESNCEHFQHCSNNVERRERHHTDPARVSLPDGEFPAR